MARNQTNNVQKGTEEPKQTVYLGPDYKGFKQFAVFIGNLPKELEELKNDVKVAKNLFVDIKDYANSLKKLHEKGSLIRTSFQKIVGELRKRKEK